MEAYRGKTILITGARGYIGSALVRALSDVDCRLVLLYRNQEEAWRPPSRCASISIGIGNLLQRGFWHEMLCGVDVVFHLAAQKYTHGADWDQASGLRNNVLPMLHLLDVCREADFQPKIVYASSAHLYGMADILPITECFRDDPLTPWAVQKLMAEQYLRIYSRQHGIQGITLRLASVYGPTTRWSTMNRTVINNAIANTLSGSGLWTYANRQCVRDFIYIEDVVQALLLAGTQDQAMNGQVFIVGSGEGQSITEAWRAIAECITVRICSNIVVQACDERELELSEMRNFVADTTRFQELTGWRRRVAFVDGIDQTVDAYLEHGRF